MVTKSLIFIYNYIGKWKQYINSLSFLSKKKQCSNKRINTMEGVIRFKDPKFLSFGGCG